MAYSVGELRAKVEACRALERESEGRARKDHWRASAARWEARLREAIRNLDS